MRLLGELARIDKRCIVIGGDDTKIPGILLIVDIRLLWHGVQPGWSNPAYRIGHKEEASVVWPSICCILRNTNLANSTDNCVMYWYYTVPVPLIINCLRVVSAGRLLTKVQRFGAQSPKKNLVEILGSVATPAQSTTTTSGEGIREHVLAQ